MSFSENARGASLAPVPGSRRRKQRRGSSQDSKPGRDLRTVAEPSGNAKHAARSFSPAAAASSPCVRFQEGLVDVQRCYDPLLLARGRAGESPLARSRCRRQSGRVAFEQPGGTDVLRRALSVRYWALGQLRARASVAKSTLGFGTSPNYMLLLCSSNWTLTVWAS